MMVARNCSRQTNLKVVSGHPQLCVQPTIRLSLMRSLQGRVGIGPSPGYARITTPISNISSTFRKWMTKQPFDSQISKIERAPTLAISSGEGGIGKHSVSYPTMLETGRPSVLDYIGSERSRERR